MSRLEKVCELLFLNRKNNPKEIGLGLTQKKKKKCQNIKIWATVKEKRITWVIRRVCANLL
jgi:hypothetical protein